MASRKKSKGVKLIALFIVLLMVVAFLTTGIYALFGSGGGNGVQGTYTMTDGSKMVLDASGNATLTIPGSNDAATTTYTVEGDKVTLLDPKTQGPLITFTHKGNTLVSNAGTQPEVWTKQ
jgi:hypothetical protein